MSGDEGFDSWMAELEKKSGRSVDEATTDMAAVLVRANHEIDLELHREAEPRWDRLREIIRRALEFIRKVAQDFGAASYSIGVTIPPGLNASVTWNV